MAAAGPSGWTNASLDVVGGPVVADGKLLVVDVTRSRVLNLSALDSQTGKVIWTTEISPSFTPPVVFVQPVVADGVALALVPADGSASDPNVEIEGIDIATGTAKWRAEQAPVVTDAPVTCAGGADFCVPTFPHSGPSTSLAYINPETGVTVSTVAGPARNLGTAFPGSTEKGDLWSSYASQPDLIQLSPSAEVRWREPVSRIFGGSQYNPNYGWDFSARARVDVGSVGYPTVRGRFSLTGFKTVGIKVSNGVVEWSQPGFYMCGGALQFLTTDVICDFSGTVVQQKSLQFLGVGLTLDGIDGARGKITWSLPVGNARAVIEDKSQPFLDGQHVVVQVAGGNSEVLDTFSGNLTPLAQGQLFWCESEPGYKLTAPQGATDDGERTSEPVFSTCTASGAPAPGVPATHPSSVGVTTGGLFVWLAPHGLQAAPAA
ncbi:MAG TPA: PQQ-binding-like beta-propeller repeat protein [Acidimicrobiales bacterium]|nr:PQQ-binding-like beta-propeller repeat protein [Acidimicrobiales bacterium]